MASVAQDSELAKRIRGSASELHCLASACRQRAVGIDYCVKHLSVIYCVPSAVEGKHNK